MNCKGNHRPGFPFKCFTIVHPEPCELCVIYETKEWHIQRGRDAFIQSAVNGDRVGWTVELAPKDVGRSRDVDQICLPVRI